MVKHINVGFLQGWGRRGSRSRYPLSNLLDPPHHEEVSQQHLHGKGEGLGKIGAEAVVASLGHEVTGVPTMSTIIKER